MSKFEVIGGRRLKGELVPQGAKNEALQVICACLLTREEVIISNIPEILDVMKLIDLLRGMGVKVDRLQKGEYSFRANAINFDYLETEDFYSKAASLRGSIMILGPLLAMHVWCPNQEGIKSDGVGWIPISSVSRNWEPRSSMMLFQDVTRLLPRNCGGLTCYSMRHP